MSAPEHVEPPLLVTSPPRHAAGTALALNRAQRRGRPIIARAVSGGVRAAVREGYPHQVAAAAHGAAGMFALACRRRGWPEAAARWAGTARMLDMAHRGDRPLWAALRWIASAERAMYRAALESGEGGGRARSRRRKRRG